MATIKSYRSKGKTRYMFKVYLGTDPLTGKRIDTTRRGFSSAREAKQALTQLKAEFDAGTFKTKAQDITLGELFEKWWQIYKSSVKQRTANDRFIMYQNHFGKYDSLKLSKLTSLWAQGVVNELSKDYKSYRNYLSPLKMALKYAVRIELISKNPFDQVIYPKAIGKSKFRTRKENNFYSKAELKKFLECAKLDDNPMIYPLFRLAAYTGARSGELVALNWKDVNFNDKTISISKTVVYDTQQKTRLITPPKTPTSIRTIFLDDETLRILKAWKTTQARLLLKRGVNALEETQLIFPNNKNRIPSPALPNSMLFDFYKRHPDLRKISAHGFRHTHATLLLEAGLNIKDVQERLEHSDIKTTLGIYSHVTEAKKKETSIKFADFLEN